MSLRYLSTSPFIAAVMCVAASASLAACGDASAPGELAGGGAEELAAEGGQALSVPLDIDTQRSLILTKATDPLAVSRFPLQFVLDQLIMRAGTGDQQTALDLYQRWWDYFNRSDGAAQFTDVPHCSDQTHSEGWFTLNGYRIQCPRREGRLATSDPFDPSSPDFMEPLAVVNRFDLAPQDGSHCGEYRIVYGKKSAGQADRNLIIFEAQLPNPHPECGVAACLPVAEFWARLPTLSAAERAQELETFFTVGLLDAGFGPVLHPDNYADAVHGPAGRPGTGQIRTNQFMGNPGAPTQVQPGQDWGLREFKLVKAADGPNGQPRLHVKPVPVEENPFADLFGVNFDPSDPRKASFMDDFLESVDKLTTFSSNINDIQLKGSTQALYNAGESLVRSDNDYALQLEPPFNFPWNFELRDRIQAELVRLGRDTLFSPWDVAARATTQSCAGCHQLSDGQPLGNGVTWPRKEPEKPVDEQEFRFVHVREDGELSQALTHSFLPHRDGVLKAFLAAHTGGNTCSPPAAAFAVDSDEPVPTLGGSTTH
ncbi:uncharacterized protein SOCE26_082880 [Sorangium cellulosum]|uniref:Cytochrome c domain-containing protein n=1 Tax=Sorangium cellulosum TaxID=56 RepID=A0A2L0F5R7_SORCE|nr:hypothetical protein [Sorangium cellulosum]AUX46779.1 uncharacterized protein SOCE26_082880 [Sorangium cellulosum]